MRLNLFPTAVGLWTLNTPSSFDQCLYLDLLKVHGAMKTAAGEIWDRHPHDVFDGSVPSATQLASVAIPILQRDFVGPQGRITHLQGREVVRVAGVEIMPHSDEDECHLQAVYFPNGPELDPSEDLLEQVNQ